MAHADTLPKDWRIRDKRTKEVLAAVPKYILVYYGAHIFPAKNDAPVLIYNWVQRKNAAIACCEG